MRLIGLCGFLILPAVSWAVDLPPLTVEKVDGIRKELRKLATNSSNGRSMIFIPGWVRLTFHDCVGYCDGCINLNNPDNAGLGTYITPLKKLYDDKKYSQVLSMADFWALAGIEAVAMSSEKMGRRLDIPFRYGRKECPTAPVATASNKYPDAHGATDHVMTFFGKEFGLNNKETTALLGAHTLGRAQRQNSGFDGPWVPAEDVLDNSYYRDLLNKKWTQININANRPSAADRWQWTRDDDPQFMMLNADMAFVKNLSVSAGGQSACNTTDTCSDLTSDVHQFTLLYATDEDEWLKDFAASYLKMIENVAPEYYVALKEPVASNEKDPDPSSANRCLSTLTYLTLIAQLLLKI